MGLKLNVMADDDIRQQIIALVREQVRPLAHEAVKEMVSREKILLWAGEEIQRRLGVLNVREFIDNLKSEIVKAEAYRIFWTTFTEEVRKSTREMVEEMVRGWIKKNATIEIRQIVQSIFKQGLGGE